MSRLVSSSTRDRRNERAIRNCLVDTIGKALMAAGLGCGAFPHATPPLPCDRPALAAHSIDLPGDPFQVVSTSDGCWLFVSMGGGDLTRVKGIAVLHRSAGSFTIASVLPLAGSPRGMVLTHDEHLLVLGRGRGLVFFDVERLQAGGDNAQIGTLANPPGSNFVNVTPDDRLLFVSNEDQGTILVVNLVRARENGFGPTSVIGKITVGSRPVALVFSNDGRYLYTVSQEAPTSLGWPAACPTQRAPLALAANLPRTNLAGAILTVDVARAVSDPASSVVSVVEAGCSPTRLITSEDGARAFVTARQDSAVLVFDTKRLVSDGPRALLARVLVGPGPTGVALVNGDRTLIVANTNAARFIPTDTALRIVNIYDDHQPQTLSVIDATRIATGRRAVRGRVDAGLLPRELHAMARGHTLLVANLHSVDVLDIDRLPLKPQAPAPTR